MSSRIEDLVREYAEKAARLDDAQKDLELTKKELIAEMEADQVKTSEVREGDKIYRATYYQGHRTDIDEESLGKVMDLEPYCKVVLDRGLLEAALETGEVDPFLVGKYVTERKNKPSVRFTQRAADDPV